MRDPSLDLLIRYLNHTSSETLLVIDEQTDTQLLQALRRTNLRCLSQRCDQHQHLQSLGFNSHLNDYQFDLLSDINVDIVAHRISKQKHIVNHVITAATMHLGAQKLLLAGAKAEGIKGYIKKLADSSKIERDRAAKQNELYIINAPRWSQQLEVTDTYETTSTTLEYEGFCFISKPGIYGWQKIDKGSQLLVETIAPSVINTSTAVLDLGCGYGFLSVWAAQQRAQRIVATDNNIAATHCCDANLAALHDNYEVVLSDCGATIDEQFDLIICNPPFHSGFGIDTRLTDQFLQTSQRLLASGGKAYFVVNQFIGLETKARGYFSHCLLLAQADGFSVFCLHQ